MAKIGQYLILLGLNQQFSNEALQFFRDFDVELIALSETLQQCIDKFLLGDHGVQRKGVEQIRVEFNDGDDIAFIVVALLCFEEDVLPYPGEVDGFDDEEVGPQPLDDLHLAVRTVVEELEHHHLVLQEVEDHRQVHLPLADVARR